MKTCANKRLLLVTKLLLTVGSNQQPLDKRPNALPTELCQLIRGTGLNSNKLKH